jgi:hypothetical protein
MIIEAADVPAVLESCRVERVMPERVLLMIAGALGMARCDLLAVSLFILVGLLNCFMSHMHIIPSLENETILFAI